MKSKIFFLIAFVSLAFLAGCTAPQSVIQTGVSETSTVYPTLTARETSSTPTTTVPPIILKSTPTVPKMTPNPINPNLQALIDTAIKDLAQRLSISASQIDVVEAADVTWSNTSLGCPQPGMAYADVLTPGVLIVLRVNGREYQYHAGKNSEVFYCENPVPPVPGIPGDT